MNLFTLYQREAETSGIPILVVGVIAGIAQATLLGIITIAADTVSDKTRLLNFLFLFLIVFGIMIIGKRYAMKRATILIEQIMTKLRIRISDKIRNSDLLFLEQLGKGELYTRLAYDANFISQSALMAINAALSVLVITFCLVFVALLSRAAFGITLFSLVMGIITYVSRRQSIIAELDETRIKEGKFFDMINQILDGFKELKVNRKKSDHYFSVFKTLAEQNKDLKTDVGKKFIVRLIYAQGLFYLLLAVIVFLLPRFESIDSELIIRITAAVLFLIGPTNILLAAVPLFTRASIAIKHLYELEAQLDAVSKRRKMPQPASVHPIPSFEFFTLEEVEFSYTDQKGVPAFTVGPVNLTVRQGEILFLIGGNGSGKTTLLKLLTGLYYPDSGTIKVDALTITPARYQAYREQFVTIFNDFHLFDRLYGLDNIEYANILKLLQLMKLEDKTDVVEGTFTNLDLSTGQRKRLSMIVALLEDRPIYVLDEWGADQDPNFRKYYYEELLSELKEQGKTIIAVSHDDRYFHVADRVIKMECGQFVSQESHQHP